jgi:Caspase domain
MMNPWRTSMRGAILIAIIGSLFAVAANTKAFAEKQVALVIGNSNYANAPKLTNPVNDAAAVSVMLETAGFAVELRNDLNNSEMRRAIRDFSDQTQDADVAVVYYAGHGIEVDGTNFLIPIDAKLERDIDVEDEAIALDRILKTIEPARRLRLVILDACRDNPFTRSMKRTLMSRSIGRGLAQVEPTLANTMIAFAAKAGATAMDGDTSNSPFTTAVVNNIAVPGLDLRIAFGNVRDAVFKSTGGRQEPYTSASLGGGTIALVRNPTERDEQTAEPSPGAAPTATGTEAWRDYELAVQVNTIEVWDSFLREHSTGFYANLARAQRAKLLAAIPPTPPVPPVPTPAAALPVATAPPATPTRTIESSESSRPSVKRKPTREPYRRAARQERGHGGGGDSICGRVRTAVRAATAAGLDNGVGVISAARSYCGG